MNNKVSNAVARLKKILPLQDKLLSASDEDRKLYQLILKSYIETGRSLNRDEMAQHVEDLDATIDYLQSNDMVIFDDHQQPIGAYPFTMEKRVHVVKANNKTLHAMCALDALAISPMFNIATQILSRCAVSGNTISIYQDNLKVINADENQHTLFGINWNAAADNCCATSLCTEMIFLYDEAIANDWSTIDTTNREVFSLNEAITFASDFFKPLIIKFI